MKATDIFTLLEREEREIEFSLRIPQTDIQIEGTATLRTGYTKEADLKDQLLSGLSINTIKDLVEEQKDSLMKPLAELLLEKGKLEILKTSLKS